MRIVRIEDASTETRTGGIFLGAVEMKALIGEATGALDLKLDVITFPPGVRNRLHSHSCDQALYILSGKGIVATEKEEVAAEPGMVFFIPRGEKHWHGAAKEDTFSHISILGRGKTEW